ncbi:TIGR02281 family clan AA aspartic protease [Piscinibacter sp. HJYY11]|uniref:retropepsin-like aspartic protease family protein n=1 Tax=Piscinibacter sp. HJYY11 TaxID=2801333 RepID=UPI00191CF837|nr:retropepsin-like aspartic protease [Piscinibacter sp. HJYY11]MBL0729465.1 retroviral-like aspartic protease family protein [Piscinibacter sp. HJYY11]
MKEFPHTAKIITVWLLIGVVVFLGFRYFEHERERTSFQVTNAGVIEIRRGPDGHYHWPGTINGRAVDFLIDTGATRTAMSQALARELSLEPQQAVRSQTAGGVVTGELVRADVLLQGGVRVERLAIVALAGLDGRPLLGMDVMGRLRWQQRDGVLSIHTEATP